MICPTCQLVEIDNEDEPQRNTCRVCQQMELAVSGLSLTDGWFWIEDNQYLENWFRKYGNG